MRILIGYSMRSGSTLLQHILNEHSRLRSYSDISSYPVLARLAVNMPPKGDICVKPVDMFYLWDRTSFYRHFDRFIWLARDPRDSYLSSVESKYAYLFWRRGSLVHGIDTGLLDRWKRVYRQYFEHADMWRLVRYEDLVTDPEPHLTRIFEYLGLPYEQLLPFRRFIRASGGDQKLAGQSTVHNRSVQRYQGRMTDEQVRLFTERLGREMQALGYA